MQIGRKFNELTLEEYFFYIDNHKNYKDFNTLGLYRSIIENEKLNIDDKIVVRGYAHKSFAKTFDFLQLKDPQTFLEVSTIGQELTKADKNQLWEDIRKNQQKILSDKKIKHRNFGTYSKHSCPYDDCFLQGVMISQSSRLGWCSMTFVDDKFVQTKAKSEQRKSDRKKEKQIIDTELALEK